MRNVIFPVIAAAALTVLGGCSKPASAGANETASRAGATTPPATVSAGGAVSPPSTPENGAVNTDANKGSSTPTPGSNSFTKSQAKGHIENAGYSDVMDLQKTPDGLWTGTAKKDGKPVHVALDFKGAVTTN